MSLVHPWRTFTPAPYKGRVFCTLLCPLLAVAVHNELLAFCKPYGRFLPFISAAPPLRVFNAASLFFASLSLLCLHRVQLLLPDCMQCSHANPAMYCFPVLLHPLSLAQDRSSGRTGNPCRPCLTGWHSLSKLGCDFYADDEQ